MHDYKNYINGEFRTSPVPIACVNPATEETFARFYEASENDFSDALSAARRAGAQWRASSYAERAQVLREIACAITANVGVLADLETRQIGKAMKESLFVDIPLGAACFTYYASLLETLSDETLSLPTGASRLSYEPFGVCGVYLPYNVPLMTFGFTCAAALAAGNSLIIKPSEHGCLSLLQAAAYLDALDIPKGLINIVAGSGPTVGSWLAQSPVDLISFTGSRATLKKVMGLCAEHPKKIICELGGCNLAVVRADANIESALENILASGFMKQGQMCIGSSVVLIDKSIYKQFIRGLVGKVESIKVGDPFEATVGMGPLVTDAHRAAVNAKVEDAIVKGAKVLTGGEALKQPGYFYQPTVLELGEMLYEEFFAPVLLVKECADDREAERIIDANPTGLVLQVWTQDMAHAQALCKRSRCGTAWINTFAQMNPQTPFGGMGESGWGRNLGKAGFFEYAHLKHTGTGFTKSPVEGWFGV